jgi:tRNA modification GTPase
MSADGALDETIFALSSGRPPAAVSVIRTSGPRAFEAARLIAGVLPQPRRASLRTLRDPSSGLELDSAIVVRFDAPHTATGEDIVEYQCHGGRAVVDAILAALAAMDGMRLAQPGEFTRRALANGRIDLTEAEGLADLLEAETESQRRAAMLMADGDLSRQIHDWRDRLVMLSARAEAAIDYVGDEDETALDTADLRRDSEALAGEMRGLLERPRVERLKDGVRVVVAGPPNAGKSSLINALSKSDRAIVTDLAGTTRDVIEVPVAIGGIPFVLVDTAGLRDDSDDRVEAIGIERARNQVDQADILLWLGVPAECPDHSSRILVQSKADLVGTTQIAGVDLWVSSATEIGLDNLVDKLVEIASEMIPGDGQLALNARQFEELAVAAEALGRRSGDLVLMAEGAREGLAALDRLSGRVGIEDMLDALFGRFCLGK